VPKEKLLNEYEAAVKVGLSPTLLRWLAKYAPKQGSSRKLRIKKMERDVVFIEEEELFSFNEWLKQPWPQKDGKRPPIAAGIREEIKTEANGECAICQSHKDTCEAAHLDPVSNSRNNHPENLLWLCSNHHTAYDDGLFGPDPENAEFVASYKGVLHNHKRMLWRMQGEVSGKLFSVLADCHRLAEQLNLAKTQEQVTAVERLATQTLAMVPDLGPVSRTDPHYDAYRSISLSLDSLTTKVTQEPANVKARLREAKSIQKAYVTALGFVACPLCEGTGQHDGYDCPECGGEGDMPEWRAEKVDVNKYEVVDCPLCEGSGTFQNEVCPECGGEGDMPEWRAEKVDVNKYEDVDCPLCEGSGTFQNEVCPECGGEGDMPEWRAENVDVSKYEDVDCPQCSGKGRFRGDDCSFCEGNGKVPRHAADRFDAL
jgi:RecJ-like exonuclease